MYAMTATGEVEKRIWIGTAVSELPYSGKFSHGAKFFFFFFFADGLATAKIRTNVLTIQ